MKFKRDKEKLTEEKNNEEEKIKDQETAPQEETLEEILKEIPVTDEVKENLEEKLRITEKELETYKDRLLRKAAEFENYKRRTENDQLNLFKYAGETFISKLLPVIDDFERSLIHIKDAKDIDSIKDGIQLVYDKLMKMLDDQGVKPIESIGKPFDVHYHEAIMQKKADNVEPHTVIEEFEKGYIYKDRVIRHTKVAVSEDNQTEQSDLSDQTDSEKQNNIESQAE